jgi:hypothetical protein
MTIVSCDCDVENISEDDLCGESKETQLYVMFQARLSATGIPIAQYEFFHFFSNQVQCLTFSELIWHPPAPRKYTSRRYY